MTEEFWRVAGYEWFVSTLVKEEISWATTEVRNKMEDALQNFNVLTLSDECEKLAGEYIKNNIFPERYRSDALHVAIAVANDMDYLVSWNFKHLVKVKTRRMVNLTNEMLGYGHIEIIAPPELALFLSLDSVLSSI
ncbi:MAG: type II toxin-antitoxin system VapC family toxin [Halobacteriota archaeon]